MIRSSRITIQTVFDNISKSNQKSCRSLWGFSSFIQTPECNILFDTGSNGRALLENLKNCSIELSEIDIIFLSHGHWDHIGGLDSIVELNSNVELVVSKHLSKNFIKDYSLLTKKVTVIEDKITKIKPDIYSTGSIGEHLEHSLVLDSDNGVIIITGCSHGGVDNIVKHVSRHFNKDILLVMGGFHMSEKSDKEVLELVDLFNQTNTKYIAPSHCTGENALKIFREHMKGVFIESSLGVKITFDENLISHTSGHL